MFENIWRRTGQTVLIVAENPARPGLDSAFLRQPDIRLLTSYPSEEALEIARRERPNLIIEDLESPDGDGMSFCARLRSDPATRSIPLILVTDPALRDRTGSARPDVLLEKPLGRHQLFQAVCRFLPLPHRRGRRSATNLRFVVTVGDQILQAFSRDVSSKGAFLKTDRVPPLGARVDLRFQLPGCSGEIGCKGLVRNTSNSHGHGQSGGMGIEFENLEECDREQLEYFIAHQLQRQHL